MALRIEISKSPNKKGTLNLREGDIEGSQNLSNMSKENAMGFIEDWIDELLE